MEINAFLHANQLILQSQCFKRLSAGRPNPIPSLPHHIEAPEERDGDGGLIWGQIWPIKDYAGGHFSRKLWCILVGLRKDPVALSCDIGNGDLPKFHCYRFLKIEARYGPNNKLHCTYFFPNQPIIFYYHLRSKFQLYYLVYSFSAFFSLSLIQFPSAFSLSLLLPLHRHCANSIILRIRQKC